MDFKFKKGENVHVKFGEMFSSTFEGPAPTTKGPGLRITDRRIYNGKPEYKVKYFSGWWPEENLVPVPRASKNSPSCDESSGAIKDQGPNSKRDTDENKAEWEYSEVDPVYVCSVCSYVALNDGRGNSVASKFCPHCGKYMINHQQEEED